MNPWMRCVLAAATVAGCTTGSQTATEPELLTVPLFSHQGPARDGWNFRTHATGSEEVPPNDSHAQGQAVFQLSADGTELRYKVLAANIQNVTQAHIHMGAAGTTGMIVAWLYPPAPPSQLIPGRFQGVLSEGTITDASLMGPLAGMTVADLLDAIRGGNAYVNVHTSQFPPGEIRGQID